MIVEIALCVGAGALAVLVGLLVPLLIQLRKPVAESEYLWSPERRAAVRKRCGADGESEHARRHPGVVEHCTVRACGGHGRHGARVHETVQDTSRSFLFKLSTWSPCPPGGFGPPALELVKTPFPGEGWKANAKNVPGHGEIGICDRVVRGPR